MRIETCSKNLPLTRSLEDSIFRAVLFSLGRFTDAIDRVRVSVSDVNGPRGGIDKLCRIQVDLGGLGRFIVQGMDAKAAVAVDEAAERAGRTVRRALDRRTERRRRAARERASPEAVAGGRGTGVGF
jgi:putative sigma-54 modulation protein